MESNEYLNFAKEMCSEAGKIMKKYFYQDSGISYKGDRTIVTLADRKGKRKISKSFCRWRRGKIWRK